MRIQEGREREECKQNEGRNRRWIVANLLRCHTLVDLSVTKVLMLLFIRDPNKHIGSQIHQTYNKILSCGEG